MAVIDFSQVHEDSMSSFKSAPLFDLSTSIDNITIDVYGANDRARPLFSFASNLIGRVRLDMDHPIAARYIAATKRGRDAHHQMSNLYIAFERAPGIFTGMWAAFKMKLVERKLIEADLQSIRDRSVCVDELRHHFD